jgi:uncharacterized protein (TIGR03067 family)
MRTGLALTAVVLLAVTSATLAQTSVPLEGAWTAIAAERDGKSAADVVGHTLTFAKGRFSIERHGKRLYAGTYTTNPAPEPAQIDFRNAEGGLRGTWKGIFRIDADTLRTCDNAPDMKKPRPREFAAAAGSGVICIVFRRDQP